MLSRACQPTLDAEADPFADKAVLALAKSLSAILLAISVEWKISPAVEIARARELMTEAAGLFLDSGDRDEWFGARLRLGQFYLMGAQPDRVAAREVFTDSLRQASEMDAPIQQAEAALRLAEIEPERQARQAYYQTATQLFERAGHALGPADVWFSHATHTNVPLEERMKSLQQALALYRQQGDLRGQNNVHNTLALWYTQQGDLEAALVAHQANLRIARRMGFVVAEATARLGLGDYYFRRGDFARTVAEYEAVEQLAGAPAIKALRKVSLANLYTQMNLHERALTLGREALATFQEVASLDNLSLAYFVLGNVLAGKRDWSGALEVWQEGCAIDRQRGDRNGEAEKLCNIAHALVLRHYTKGHGVPPAICQEALALYEQARAVLAQAEDQQAMSIKAGSWQVLAQNALAGERLADAVQWLGQARELYATLDWRMQTAMTDIQLGLACMRVGQTLSPGYFAEAEIHHRRALHYFEQAGMREQCWQIKYLLADCSYRQGLHDIARQPAHWQAAAGFIEDAATDIEFIRGDYLEAGAANDLAARVGLVADKEKVYLFAIQLHAYALRDHRQALDWAERLKGRALLDALAFAPLAAPMALPATLVERERALLQELRQTGRQETALALNEQLNALWNAMAEEESAAAYVAIRRGSPISWEELRQCLQTDNADV